jgi:hypothetical protein
VREEIHKELVRHLEKQPNRLGKARAGTRPIPKRSFPDSAMVSILDRNQHWRFRNDPGLRVASSSDRDELFLPIQDIETIYNQR